MPDSTKLGSCWMSRGASDATKMPLQCPGADQLTYSSYLRIPELLSLQQQQSTPPQHDELLFIVIHQTYELWFKELLHDLDAVVGCFRRVSADAGAR